MAPLGLPEEAHLRIRNLWEPLDLQILTQGDVAAAGVEIKALLIYGQRCRDEVPATGGDGSLGRKLRLTCPSEGAEVSGGPCSQEAGSKSRAVAQ